MKKKKSPFAESEGKLFVKAASAGMHFLCLMIDGIRISYFGKAKTPYLHIDDAIRWHEKEIEASEGQWPRKTLDALIAANQAFQSERPKTPESGSPPATSRPTE
jgi:hypothetical protein